MVSSVVFEETFECDKCDVVFVDKTDLRTHMIGYHEVLKQCRFCPFKFSRDDLSLEGSLDFSQWFGSLCKLNFTYFKTGLVFWRD